MQQIKRDYEAFYAQGGWDYEPEREKRFLQDRVVTPLGLRPGARILDLGCGIGLFSGLFHELDFEAVGVDLSPTGIAHARKHHPGPTFLNLDAAQALDHFEPASFDMVYIRGMSWYHYELDGVNKLGIDVPAWTAEFCSLVKPGGVFLLQIKTDMTGAQPEAGVHHNRVSQFRALFAPLGNTVLVTDWDGRPLVSDADGEASGRNIIIAARLP